MAYRLGVDLGTTFTAAAISDGSTEPTLIGLGNRALQIPSVLFLKPDGEFAVGEAAERRGLTEPDRLAREFKRRIGDHVPIFLAGAPFSPQALTAHLLRWVVDAATERMGEPPAEVVLTHPANWGPFRLELLEQVALMAEVGAVQRCTEPEAAAAQYAAQTRVVPGDRVAVYDLGGGTFDACVLEKTGTGFRALGTPEGVEHLGGVDFDEAVLRHVLDALGPAAVALDPADPAVTVGLARLRRDCVEAKEALSTDVDIVVPVALPGLSTTVRVTRAELERMLRPALAETVAAMSRALQSAQVEPATLRSILLVGGSSRIPLVSEMLTQEFAVSTALDTHPKHDVALGSLRAGRDEARPPREAVPVAAIPDAAVPDLPPAEVPLPPRRRLTRVLAGVLALVVVGAGAGVAIALGNDEGSTADPPPTSAAPAASTPVDSPTPSATPTPPAAPPPRWRRGTALPEPLEAAGVTVFGDAVWVVGGNAPTSGRPALDRVWFFQDGWQPGPRLPVRLDSASVASDGKRLFVVGGRTTDADGGNQKISRDVWVLDGPDDGSWDVLNQIPEPRASGAVAWDGQRLVFAGGADRQDPDGDGKAENVNHADVWAWDGGGEWRAVGRLQRQREDLAAASDGNGRVWFLGGADLDEDDRRVPLGAVDLVQQDRIAPLADIEPLRSSAAVWRANRGVCLFGGVARAAAAAKDSLTNALVCVPGTVSPSPTSTPLPPLPLPRAGAGAAVQGERVWLVGGFGPERKGGPVAAGLSVVEVLGP